MSFLIIFLHIGNVFGFGFLNFIFTNGVCRIGVPFFLVVSGYYFYGISDTQALKKWSVRVLSLYSFWMVFYSPFWIRGDGSKIITIFFGYYTLWYVIGLFFSGLILYNIRKMSIKLTLSIAIIFYILGYTIQTIGHVFVLDGLAGKVFSSYLSYRNFIFDCFPFMAIGMIINRLGLSKIKVTPWLLLPCLAILIFESSINYYLSPKSVDLMLSLLITTPILFISISKIRLNSKTKNLSHFASGLFLSQALFINLYKHFYDDRGLESFFYISICTSIASVALIYLSRKIKFII